MNNSDTIAVLLSVYRKDNPAFLITAIESILSQTYDNIQLLIGVDGPVDGALDEVINNYSNYPRVVVIRFKENRGLACVLNDLLYYSRNKGYTYLARMDADDVSPRNRFEKQKSFLDINPDVDVVGGSVAEIREDGSFTGKIVRYPATHEECKKRFQYRDPLSHPGVMFRSRFFEKAKGYRGNYRKNQDTMLWLDGFLSGCIFANINDVVINFRVNDDLYKNRRGGLKQASRMFKNRMTINKEMGYGFCAYFFAFAMFIITILPSGIRRIIYEKRP